MVEWKTSKAAVWRGKLGVLRAVQNLDPVTMDQLIGVDEQKNSLMRNTEGYLQGSGANHALLWGARGSGKSSMIKAILNAYSKDGLRLIEIEKYDLPDLPEIVDEIREKPFKFIVYCDDLSFDVGERAYKSLKTTLEGSVELPPENVLVYASSNRRHMVPEHMADNQESRIINGELHYSDRVEEQLALADRFGLWLSFYPNNWEAYYKIVESLFVGYQGDQQELLEAARLFAMSRGGSKSGRTAKQFFHGFYQANQEKFRT